jgi:hypothetical protein
MSGFDLEPRNLGRDKESGRLRDDRIFLVACDDTFAPEQYLGFLKLPRIRIVVVPTTDGTSTAGRVLERLLEVARRMGLRGYDERWMVLDTDHCVEGTHQAGFVAALHEAKRRGVQVALSRPCFELWLLLHHLDEGNIAAFENCRQIEAALRVAAGAYSKTRLKLEHYRGGAVVTAILRAERLDATVGGGDIPTGNTTRFYRLLKSIAARSLPSQLPSELRALR